MGNLTKRRDRPASPRLVLVAWLAGALALSLAGPGLAAGTGLPGKRSLRAPLTGENFYFLMPDRFANGSTANDRGDIASSDRLVTGLDPTHRAFFHGGDLKGLRDRLGYIDRLGTTAIWLTPVFKNQPVDGPPGFETAGYHGFWGTDFTRVDPHYGSNAELEALVRAAHRRGIKVFLDIVVNHTADVITYEAKAGGPTPPAYVSKDAVPYRSSGTPFDDRDHAGKASFPALNAATSFPFVPQGGSVTKVPDWLNDVRLYHNRGDTTFVGENMLYGDFFGLDDLFTEHPQVVAGMTAIYKRWIKDFGIDGFRATGMNSVDDTFWQRFAPEIVRYARAQGKRQFFLFGEVFDRSVPHTSRFSTRNRVQAVSDFPFQAATQAFAAGSAPTHGLRDHFLADDLYTDADSNAYQLATFLGNADMGRFGSFATTANPGAAESELLARSELAHELMYLSRGNPTVLYGDEQGFVGEGGDLDARQDMFPSQTPQYAGENTLGSDATPADANFDEAHPLYLAIQNLAALVRAHPALRSGPQQHRYSTSAAGLYAFSRFDRRTRREYLVVLNNAETSKSAAIATSARQGERFERIYGLGAQTRKTDAKGRLSVLVAPLSAVVYRSAAPLPLSAAAPRISLAAPSGPARDRLELKAAVRGKSLCDVTFYAKIGSGSWKAVGTDDNTPYRVFHDLAGVSPGTSVQYRAVVLDNASHRRESTTRTVRVAAPGIALTAPADGARVRDSVRLDAVATPDKPTYSVMFQRSVNSGPWVTRGVDSSQPVYTYVDDVSTVAADAELRYRAILTYASGRTATSAARSATIAPVVTTAVIHYHRPGGDYADWGVHLWGDGTDADTSWDAPLQRSNPTVGPGEFGARYEIPLTDDTQALGFIVHRPSGDTVPTNREPGGDHWVVPMQNPEIWLKQGDGTIYTSEPPLP